MGCFGKHLGDRFKKITSVINVAGISEPSSIEDETVEHWNRIHAINGTSVFLGCQFGVKAMKESKGTIVNFASSLATRPKPFVVSYNYSKAGVLILTRTVALHCAEMGYNIRCNAVQPGAIDTPMMRRYVDVAEDPNQQLVEFAASHPMNRIGQPDEVVSAVLFLAYWLMPIPINPKRKMIIIEISIILMMRPFYYNLDFMIISFKSSNRAANLFMI